MPILNWRRSYKTFSSGQYRWWGERITITAGHDRKDQKYVLIHELAHWLCPAGAAHNALYWDKAWELFRRYKVPIRYAKERSGAYRNGAIAAYQRSRAKKKEGNKTCA
jgi:hypothetical protein